jgi:hypothetical protein
MRTPFFENRQARIRVVIGERRAGMMRPRQPDSKRARQK